MALLVGPGTRVFDANGNLISGGKIRVYEANTTTLASIYSDAALSSALSNPCVANSAGWPASGSTPVQIFAASGSYDVAFLDASNNVLASFEDVPTVGEDAAEIDRVVSGNGRIKITGSAGSVLIQAGSPSPDNTGGALVIEGWAGTQLDTLELDAAAANVSGNLDVDGTLTASGGKSIDVVLASGAQSAATNLDLELTGSHRSYTLELSEIIASTGTALFLRVSTDNGSTYLSTSIYDNMYQTMSTSSVTPGGATGGTAANVSVSNLTTTAGDNSCGVVEIEIPTSGTGKSHLKTRFDIGNGLVTNLVNSHINAGARPTHIRVYSSSGNWTGRYRLRTRKD